MLVIKPIQDKELQENICKKAGISYIADALCYVAYVDDVEVGISQFGLRDDAGYIYSFASMGEKEDTEALFIMGRAVLNFIELCGIEYADMTDCETEERFKVLIGFKKGEDGGFRLCLKNMFEHHCSHGSNN